MRRTFATAAVLLLVVTAGCLGGGGGPSTTTTAETTTRENATTTTGSGLSADSLPPGVTRDGVNATALLAAHRAGLSNATFTHRYNETIPAGETGIVVYAERAAVGEDAVSTAVTTGPRTTRQYSNGSVTFSRLRGPNVTEYAVVDRPVRRDSVLRLDIVRPYLAGGAFEPVETVTRDGTRLVRLRTTGAAGTETLREAFEASSVNSFEGTALVDTAGRIRSVNATVEFVPENGGDAVTFRLRYALSAVGSTTVDRPEWLGTARERATRFDLRRVDGPALALTPTRGSLGANATVRAFMANATGTATLSQPVGTGETVYLSARDGTVRVTRTRPSGDLGAVDPHYVTVTSANDLLVLVERAE